MTPGPPEKGNTKAIRWMIGAAAVTVAAPIITTTSGSESVAFNVDQDGRDGISGEGQV